MPHPHTPLPGWGGGEGWILSYLFIYLLISIRTCRLQGRVDVFLPPIFFFPPLSSNCSEWAVYPSSHSPGKVSHVSSPSFSLPEGVGSRVEWRSRLRGLWSDPEAPPLTPPEQCQTLVLEDCSRRLAGGGTSPDSNAEASAHGESRGLGRTHSQCKGVDLWPLSRLWSLMPLKQRLGPERRPADCDRGWKTGWHGAVYPSPPAPPGKEAQTLWGEGMCAPCSAGLSHCLHPWFSPWGGASLPHHAANGEETHSLAPSSQGGWGGCWWVPRPLS